MPIAAVRTLEQWSAASALGALLLGVAMVIAVVIAIRVTLRR